MSTVFAFEEEDEEEGRLGRPPAALAVARHSEDEQDSEEHVPPVVASSSLPKFDLLSPRGAGTRERQSYYARIGVGQPVAKSGTAQQITRPRSKTGGSGGSSSSHKASSNPIPITSHDGEFFSVEISQSVPASGAAKELFAMRRLV